MNLAPAISLVLALSGAAQSPLAGKPAIVGTPFRVHDGMVTAIDYTPDGTQILTMSMTGDVRIWDAKTGRRLQAWTVGSLVDTAVFCGRKAERVAIGEPKVGIHLFDARTGKEVAKVPDLVRPAAAPDGSALAAVTADGQMVFVDPMTGTKSAPIAVGKQLHGVTFSPDGKTVLVDELMAGKAYLVDRAQAKVVATIEHGAMKGGFRFTPDGKHLFGHAKQKARKLALPGGEVAQEWSVPIGITGLVARGDGAEVLVTDLDGIIAQIELASGTVKHEYHEHRGLVNRMVVSRDGKVLVSGGWDGTVHFFDLDSGKEVLLGPDHNGPVTAVALAGDGKSLASGAFDNSTILWQADGKAVARAREHAYLVTGVAVAADGTWWSASQDGSVRNWTPAGKEKARFQFAEGVFGIPLCPLADGGTILVGTKDGALSWRSLPAGTEAKCWQGHGSAVVAIAADAKGEFVASLEEGGQLFVWDAGKGEPRLRLPISEEGGKAACLAGDGVVVASGGKGALVRFDGKAGKETHRQVFGDGKEPSDVEALAAVPARGVVFAASGDRVHVLAAADLKRLGDVQAPTTVSCLAVSADGTTLAAGLVDGTIALWKLAPVKPAK